MNAGQTGSVVRSAGGNPGADLVDISLRERAGPEWHPATQSAGCCLGSLNLVHQVARVRLGGPNPPHGRSLIGNHVNDVGVRLSATQVLSLLGGSSSMTPAQSTVRGENRLDVDSEA